VARQYKVWIDPAAERVRDQIRRSDPRKDLCDWGRGVLHMSVAELAYVERNNPDFNMTQFVASGQAVPYSIRGRI